MIIIVDQESIEDVEAYWGDQMPLMAMEELGELVQAISKIERGKDNAAQNLIEEMGDVVISIGALMARYAIEDSEIEAYIRDKLSQKREN